MTISLQPKHRFTVTSKSGNRVGDPPAIRVNVSVSVTVNKGEKVT